MSVLVALFRIVAKAPRLAAPAGALAFLLALGCWGCTARPGREAMTSPPRPLVEVLAEHTPRLMAMPGIVGTAESRTDDGRPCILIMLAKSDPGLLAKLPSEIEGWPVRIEVTGEFRALPDSGR